MKEEKSDNKIWFIIGAAAIVVIVLVIFLITSDKSSDFVGSDNLGTLMLQITDAPTGANITSVIVIISRIEVHKANSDENDSLSWFTVVEGPLEYDLIEIKDVKQLMGSSELEAGKYTQIRLNIDSATAIIDGRLRQLQVPSDKVKIVGNFDIVQDQATTLTLDFDAEDSIIQQGIYQSTRVYLLNPVIRMIKENAPAPQAEDTQQPTGLTAKQAFEGQREAMLENNLEDFKKYTSSEAIAGLEGELGELTQEKFEEMNALARTILPPVDDVKLDSESRQGDTLTWQVSDRTNPNNAGTVEFVREGNDWRVKKESWVERV